MCPPTGEGYSVRWEEAEGPFGERAEIRLGQTGEGLNSGLSTAG